MAGGAIWYLVAKHAANVRCIKLRSPAYQQAVRLNMEYRFHQDLEEECSCGQRLDSSRRFNTFDLHAYLAYILEAHAQYFAVILSKSSENRAAFAAYASEYEALALSDSLAPYADTDLRLSLEKVRKIERKLLAAMMQNPIRYPTIRARISYTSPKGRNKRYRDQLFSFDEWSQLYCDVQADTEYRATRQYQIAVERAKLGASLRYDVLKRDGFRCQICGATARDGVKLHVDHVVPVSRRGQTEHNNLRCLCDRCNLGKSDKLED